MHFKTLVTVTMPTVEEDPHENAAVVQSIELLQARKDDLAKDIMAELTLCSLMGRTTNFARQLVGEVEEVMAPYSAEPSEEYMEFADMTEELKADYAKSVDCLKLPNGKIVECGSYPYFSKYSIVDGKVSQNKVGPLHHTRRTKQSRKYSTCRIILGRRCIRPLRNMPKIIADMSTTRKKRVTALIVIPMPCGTGIRSAEDGR